MDAAETGTAIGWIWLVALVVGPALLALVFAVGMVRSRRRAPQGPLSPGQTDPGATGAAASRPMVASGGGEAPVSPPGASPPR